MEEGRGGREEEAGGRGKRGGVTERGQVIEGGGRWLSEEVDGRAADREKSGAVEEGG